MTALELQRQVDQVDGYYKALKAREQSLAAEIKASKEEIDILVKTSAVLKHLLDQLVKGEITNMAGLVTYGLNTVFDDQKLTFVPNITKKNDKMWIELNTNYNDIQGDYESFGGSIAILEGFLLRVLCILKKKFARLMLLDETFAAVGAEYIPNTSRLISELCKKLGLDVLLVTHQKGFLDNADHAYRVRDDGDGLIMEKIK